MLHRHRDVTAVPDLPAPDLPAPDLPALELRPGDCPAVSELLARVGDKWSVLIVMTLGSGPRRFNELKRSVGGISQRMLTLTLRGLERDGLVARTVQGLGMWVHANKAEIERARRLFDQREGKPPP